MALNEALIAELQQESANTRKMLERVPVEKNDWKPHTKSMKLGSLSTHVAELPSWVSMIMATEELDFAKFDFKPVVANSTDELTAILDTTVEKAIESLRNSSDEDFYKMWTMRNGETVYFTLPKIAVMRSFAYSHIYHHRGQLSVYLRLLDIPIPGMYGPSYDEMPTPAEMEAIAN